MKHRDRPSRLGTCVYKMHFFKLMGWMDGIIGWMDGWVHRMFEVMGD